MSVRWANPLQCIGIEKLNHLHLIAHIVFVQQALQSKNEQLQFALPFQCWWHKPKMKLQSNEFKALTKKIKIQALTISPGCKSTVAAVFCCGL